MDYWQLIITYHSQLNPQMPRTKRTPRRRNPEAEPYKRRSSRKKNEPTIGPCLIGGAKRCEGEKSKLVRMNNCQCLKMCKACATAWFKTASSCPFCRADVSMLNKNEDIEYRTQRPDNDVERKAFSFEYTNFIGSRQTFNAHLSESVLFANKRARKRLPVQVLFLIKIIEGDMDAQSLAYVAFCDILFSYKSTHTRAVVTRLLFYFALEKQNDTALFFVMQLLRHLRYKRRSDRKGFTLDSTVSMESISKAIFHDVPDTSFFALNPLQIYQKNSNTRAFHILFFLLLQTFPKHATSINQCLEEIVESEEDDEFISTLYRI